MITSIIRLIVDFTAKQENFYSETVNIAKYTFKTIQELISEDKILNITTETVIKYIKSHNSGNIN
jgi:hypothetical protein